MSAAGRWFITPHAVARFRERCPGARALDYEAALGLLINLCRGAHFVKAKPATGACQSVELWRAPKPTRLRFIVAPPEIQGELPSLVTVEPAFDARGRR